MKRFIGFIKAMRLYDWLQVAAEGLVMWAMMAGLLFYLFYMDFSSAPVFIYSQF